MAKEKIGVFFRLDSKDWKALSIFCIENKTSKQDILDAFVKKFLKANLPNKEKTKCPISFPLLIK
jgi:hypothetical protein